MSESVIRLIDYQKMIVEWLMINALGTIEVHQGSIQDCADSLGDRSIILLLPAADVLLLELELPIKSNQQLKKALPFALEEWLVDEVDTYHFVWHRQSDHLIYVAAMNAKKFNFVLAGFEALGLQLTGIYSEVLALPYQDNTLSVLIEEHKIVVRTQKYLGGGIDQASLAFLIEKWQSELTPGFVLNCWSTKPLPDCFRGLVNDGVVNVISSEAILLAPIHEKEMGALDLLTRKFQPKKATDLTWKKWLPAVSIFIMSLLIQYGVLIHSDWQKKRQLTSLDYQVIDLFKQIFPEVKRIVNIKAQAEQQLVELKKQGVDKGSPFMTMIYKTGEVLGVNPDIKLKKLDYMNNSLQLHFTSQDVAKVDQVKQQLENTGHLIVTIKSIESKEANAEVDVEIKQK